MKDMIRIFLLCFAIIGITGCSSTSERVSVKLFEVTASVDTEVCKNDECKELIRKRKK